MSSIPGRGIGVREKKPSHAICGRVKAGVLYAEISAQIGLVARKKVIIHTTGLVSGEHPAVTLFRDYIRIKSVQPDPDYVGCVEFLKVQANRLGLDYHVTEMVPGKPIFIMTWPGLEPELPAILLNSHTDVVSSLVAA